MRPTSFRVQYIRSSLAVEYARFAPIVSRKATYSTSSKPMPVPIVLVRNEVDEVSLARLSYRLFLVGLALSIR